MAQEVESLVVRLAMDDSSFKQGMDNLNRSMRLIDSEFKRSKAGISNFGSSVDDLRLKSDYLNKAFQAQSEIVKRHEERLKSSRGNLSKLVQAQSELKEKVAQAKSELEKSEKTLGKNAEETTKLRQSYEQLKSEYDKGNEKIRNNVRAIENQEIALNKAAAKMDDFQRELNETNADIDKSSNTFERFKRKTEEIGSSFEKLGGSLKKTGKSLSIALTVPLAGMGKKALSASIDFESAFTGVRKTVEATEEQFAALEKSILDMSEVMPSSAVEIAGVMEAAGQLGVPIQNMEKFTKVMIDLGESTNLTAGEAADELARFANIVKMSLNDVDRLGSTVVDLGNSLATTEAEIVHMGMRLGAAGAQVGMTEAQIMGFAGALSSVGIEAEAGGTAFSKLMIRMKVASEKGGGDLENFAKVANMSASEFADAFEKNAPNAIMAFLKGLGTMEEKGESALVALNDMEISEVRLRDAVLRASNAHELFSDALGIANKAWDENVALTNEAQKRYATMESQIEMTKNKMFKVFKGFGEAMAPDVQKAIEIFGKFLDKLDALPPSAKRTIGKLALTAATLGPFLFIVGSSVSTIGKLTSAFGAVSSVIGGLKVGSAAAMFSGMAGGVSSAASALGSFVAANALAIAGVGAFIAAGVLLYKHWDDVRAFAANAWNGLSEGWESLTTSIKQKTSEFASGFSEKMSEIGNSASLIWESLSGSASSAFGNIKRGITEKLTDIRRDFENAGGGWKGALSVVWGLIEDEAKWKWNGIKTVVSGAAGALGIDLSSKFQGIERKAKDVWSRFTQIMVDPVGSAKRKILKIGQEIKDFFKNMKLKLPDINPPKLPKLPKIAIEGGFSISPPRVPNIRWYDKGGVFYGPQVIGVGERRPEFVGALDDLRKIVREESGEYGVVNHFNLYGVTVREEADIRRIASELARLLREKRRGDGR